MIESGERRKREKCHLAFQTLPVASKESDRFCGTGRPSTNLVGPHYHGGDRQYVTIFNMRVWLGLDMYHSAVQY